MMQGTITKTGNSYAIRVPKRYIDENGLKLGDKVSLEDSPGKQRQALHELMAHGRKQRVKVDIEEIVGWQKAERASWDRRPGG